MRRHPDVIAALAERGIDDPSLTLVDVWTYGASLIPEPFAGRRIGWCDVWLRARPGRATRTPTRWPGSSSSST